MNDLERRIVANFQGRSRNADPCECYLDCGEDPENGCELSGEWHVHPGEPCPVHPDAPGDR